ncbi:hypothetical protein SAMN05216389_1093 [Oceanobacillus limi]|uniref:Secreted protein n=1 Tax=Oceanobacillus limi TaxID=930131 RepID=A0A1I0DK09_9BACI|nr:hypothetical protein [Oceanobacillus limi]SET32821.1 hypothetical protein SAMN05216389_1093 [Oceanobacillus limi]
MKYKIFICLIPIVFICANLTFANEKQEPPELKVIESYQEDVTGDGHKEEIELKGILFSPESEYYRDIVAVVKNHENETWEINYGGGYEPILQFIDFNHDKVNEIFYQSPTGGSGGLHHYKLHTLIQYNLVEIPLPKQDYVQGDFKENFEVEVQISPTKEPVVVDVNEHSEDYIEKGIYDEKGSLIKNTSPMVDPIAYFEPVFISDRKGYGLKSFQQISGISHADQLGTIESLWYYDRDKWIIVKTEWVPTN